MTDLNPPCKLCGTPHHGVYIGLWCPKNDCPLFNVVLTEEDWNKLHGCEKCEKEKSVC